MARPQKALRLLAGGLLAAAGLLLALSLARRRSRKEDTDDAEDDAASAKARSPSSAVPSSTALLQPRPIVIPRAYGSPASAAKPAVPQVIKAETLPQWVTVSISTSPVVCHPSTALIEETVASFGHVEHLARCPKLIICDGYKTRGKNKGIAMPRVDQ